MHIKIRITSVYKRNPFRSYSILQLFAPMSPCCNAMNNNLPNNASPRLTMAPVEAIPVGAKPKESAAAKRPRRGLDSDKLLRQFCVLALVALLSMGCYFAISHYFVETVQVVGQSMNPTLHENNHYLLNRWAFRNNEPQRRDVVVIRDPGDNGFSVK